ncbi:hypothetical protein LJK88_49695 [Paenibacillus sp. P26]|nr:hypothetical protein LJK88_49695 [Paenibacillus sp. P26]
MERLDRQMEAAKAHLDRRLEVSGDTIDRLSASVLKQTTVPKPAPGKKWSLLGAAACLALIAVPLGTKALSGYLYMGDHRAVIKKGETTATVPITGGYVIYNGYYYMTTDELIEASHIDKQIGQVERTGEWVIKKDGDSNEFVPGAGLYTIQGIDPSDKLAVKVNLSSRQVDPKDAVYEYQAVKRAEAVGQVDTTRILASKNDPEEVAAVIANIRKIDPHLYEFQGPRTKYKLTGASYADEGAPDAAWYGTGLTYELPEAVYRESDGQTIQGFLFVEEYSEKSKEEGKLPGGSLFYGDAHNPTRIPGVREEFDLNGLHWKVYGDGSEPGVYVGQQGNRYYEIKLQGKLSGKRMKEPLRDFVPTGGKK